ncbi:MAG TPA: hypothetical protein VGF71_12740 [Caulobacteraceae bacterium]
MANSALWSGAHLNWPDLSGWIRAALAEVDRRKAAGEPVSDRPALVSIAVCRWIIAHFLGEDWFVRNAMPDGRVTSFLFPVFDGDKGTAPTYTMRIFNLAECLFHIQYIRNSICPIRALADEEQMESAIAELQIGSLLFQQAIPFRYLEPNTAPGVRTADIELWFGGRPALADVKCKYEMRDYVPGCLKSAFQAAREQIGSGNEGFVFVKVPQTWGWYTGTELMLRKQAVDEARKYMRSTSRIVKTIFYTFNVEQLPTGMRIRNAILEANKPNIPADSIWNRPISAFERPAGWLTIPDLIERALHGFPR